MADENDTKTEVLDGSDKFPATFTIGGAEVQLGTVVASAHVTSGLSVDAWNELDADTRDKWISEDLDARQAQAVADAEKAAQEQAAAQQGEDTVVQPPAPVSQDETQQQAGAAQEAHVDEESDAELAEHLKTARVVPTDEAHAVWNAMPQELRTRYETACRAWFPNATEQMAKELWLAAQIDTGPLY